MAGGEAADYAMLCLSELVSNVLIHSRSAVPGGSFTVRVRLAGDRLRVEVEDQGGAWHVRPDEDGEHGHGLRIVGELAADWGITGDSAGGRAVWFEIAAE